MLDVIVIVSETTPVQYVRHCFRTVEDAVSRASYPISIIRAEGVPGHVGQAMRNSLRTSKNRYVAWVDDDDFVLPNAFTCLTPHFASNPTAICAREIMLLANGMFIPQDRRHHLTAYRRDIVDACHFERLPARDKLALLDLVRDTAVDELSWVYVYRRRLSAASKIRALTRHQP